MVDPGYTLERASGHALAFESGLLTAAESKLAWHSQEGSYKGKVCRASSRSAFDKSGVSPYISQEPAGFSALHIDLFIPREVIRDVNTEILLGRDNFKLRAGHMIDKDDGFKFPSDAALHFNGCS